MEHFLACNALIFIRLIGLWENSELTSKAGFVQPAVLKIFISVSLSPLSGIKIDVVSLWLCLVSLVSVLIPDGCWYSSDATTHHLNFFKMFSSSLHAMFIDYIICNRYIYIDTLKNNKKMKVRQTLVGLSPMGRIIDIHRMLVNYPERYWQSKNRELHMFNSIFKHKLVTGWQCYAVTSLGYRITWNIYG